MGKLLGHLRHYIFSHFSVAKILTLSFLFLIISGTILLMMPFSNLKEPLPLIDNLFTATSATCVTGLLTNVVKDQYTVFGRFVILMLIQIGGLGLMTFISVVLLFMKTKLEFKERLLLKDALNKLDFSDIRLYIISIFKYTFVFESVGALLLSMVFIKEFGVLNGIGHAIFLSISAFCNAGIDCFGSSSLLIYQNNPIVILTVAMLIIFGGIGFAVWFDYRAKIGFLFHFKKNKNNTPKRFTLHTKMVTIVTLGLLLGGTLLILVFEYNNALADLSFSDKIMNSFFNSTTLRTAGFFSIDYSILHRITKIVMIVFMLIGGSPGGTAGGIKTTTFFLLLYVAVSEFKGHEHMHIYGRHIGKKNFIKAYIIFAFYLLTILFAFMILLCTEPFESLDILFEVVSAIGTVGLTIGITADLSIVGKIVIILLMFIGRVGPITIAYSFRNDHKNEMGIKYPRTEIIVG